MCETHSLSKTSAGVGAPRISSEDADTIVQKYGEEVGLLILMDFEVEPSRRNANPPRLLEHD